MVLYRIADRISEESASRTPAQLKAAAKRLLPGLDIISLGGGLPSSDYFPFETLSAQAPAVGKFSVPEMRDSSVTITAGKHDMAEGSSIFDISTALNYGQGTGSPQLLRWITEHTELVHNPPYSDWQCTMTIGSTSALDVCLRMFRHPGPMCILSEEFTFSTAVEAARGLGIRVAGVAMDDQGLLATSLDDVLTRWDPAAHGGAPKPFILYTVPTGQNPSGATQGTERRRAIYAVAQRHDLLILEDEPYYFLQMQPYTGRGAADAPAPASHAAFLAALAPSLLSMDIDGRVVRLDSFSKVIAPGARVGWITAPAQLAERYYRAADVATQSPSGLSQLLLFKLLDEHWGHAGYLDWLMHLRREYTRRRDGILAACEAHLPRAVASWKPPMAGMFHWIRIDWRRHPLARDASAADADSCAAEVESRIYERSIARGALVIPGSWFAADGAAAGEAGMFFRTTYAAVSQDRIEEAIRRFGRALRDEFGQDGPADADEAGGERGHAVGNGDAGRA